MSLHDLTFSQLAARLEADGVKGVHARALWRALHREARASLTDVCGFSPPLQRWLAEHPPELDLPPTTALIHSSDGLTRKLLLKLEDGQEIETVVMGYTGRFTVCASTQAGCAMGCVFCATGQMGFKRHLRPGEIVAQLNAAQRLLHAEGEKGPRNLVLMGMGEPLHNLDNVLTALEIITDRRGINIGPSKISISTVGHVPGIRRLTAMNAPYNLAVSLHATSDDERSALMPMNRRWPLAELLDALHEYQAKTGRRIFIEWTLIAGKNDSIEQARSLATLLHGMDAHINLIPLNPTPAYEGAPTAMPQADAFQLYLQEAGFPSTIRQRRGIDVAAGCGQLRATR